MVSAKSLTFALALLVVLVLSGALSAGAGEPTDQIRTTVEKAVAILTRPDSGQDGRREELRQVLMSRFDFEEMAKRSLGPYWRKLSAPEQKEFVALFTTLLEGNYMGRIEQYNKEHFVYTGEQTDGDYATVETRIVTGNGREFPLNYKLHRVAKTWLVYDLEVENIKVVNNYRAQFNRVILNSSYQELIERMRIKGRKPSIP